MTWGIFVYKMLGYHHYRIAEDPNYKTIRNAILSSPRSSLVWERKGIKDDEIERVAGKVNNLNARLDNGESFEFDEEMKRD